jgi:hypothetical protein
MAKGLRSGPLFTALMLALLAGAPRSNAQPSTQQRTRCTCRNGQSLEVGAVSYSEHSGRETITRVEPDAASPANPNPANRCRALWVGSTEIQPVGTPYEFHLERTRAKERRIDSCEDLSGRFVTRTTKYEFVFDSNSVSIREIRIAPGAGPVGESDPQGKSNSNLWNSIGEVMPLDPEERAKRASQIDTTREFNRRSWILARTGLKGHHVGIVRDAYGVERVVPLKKTRTIKAGQLGQIEAVGPGRAIVRFYEGSRVGRFGRTANSFRRWYDRIGGPYLETNDDLYTPLRACVLEVSLDDIVEINDYLDQGHTDRTSE